MSKGMSLERVVRFFREADLDVAEITLMHVTNIVGMRRKREAQSADSQMKRALPAVRKRGVRRIKLSGDITTAEQARAVGLAVNESLGDA